MEKSDRQKLGTARANTRRALMRRLRDDITRIEQHMPHRCPETQSRAQWTRSELMARLAMLEAADGDPAPRRRCGVSA